MNNLAKYHGCLERHDLAIQIKWDAIRIAKEHRLITVFANAYIGIAWNMIVEIKKGIRPKSDIGLCKQYLRMSYATASLSGDPFTQDYVRKYYTQQFGENIYWHERQNTFSQNTF